MHQPRSCGLGGLRSASVALCALTSVRTLLSGLCARVVCGLWLRPELKAAWPVPVALLARFLAKRIRFINMFHSVRLPSAEEERRRGYVQTERHRRLGRARASGDGKLTRDPQKRSGARRRGAQVLRLLRMRDGRHGKRRPHPPSIGLQSLSPDLPRAPSLPLPTGAWLR